MIPALVNNPLFRGITPERLFADLEEISFHTRSYKKGGNPGSTGSCVQSPRHPDQRKRTWRDD